MRAQISAYDAPVRKRFADGHTIEVDARAYKPELLRERRRTRV
ncbi:MAG TPA: hypothetical protein VGJ41_09015 [Nocardioides sp.]|jgi:hypothetical protein